MRNDLRPARAGYYVTCLAIVILIVFETSLRWSLSGTLREFGRISESSLTLRVGVGAKTLGRVQIVDSPIPSASAWVTPSISTHPGRSSADASS